MPLASIMLLASCSDDNFAPAAPDGGNVSFTINIPGEGIGSRVFGDGLSASSLKYAVYDEDGEKVMSGDAGFSGGLSTTVSLQLANGHTYDIAFFAYKNYNNIYDFNADEKCVTIDYASMATITNVKNDLDCFYKVERFEVKGAIDRTVTLTRPVAQVNWGTNDLNSPVVDAGSIYTRFVGKAYSKLDLLTGKASEEVEVKAKKQTKPIEESYGTFPGAEGYDYLNMMYLLVSEEGTSLIDAKLEVHTSSGSSSTPIHVVNVPNLPVERNYRTNIYGSLLTSTANITVTKSPAFGNPDHNQEIWQGNIKTPMEVDGVYHITSSAELAGIAQLVNNGNSLQGKTVVLENDLDLGNRNWTPIGLSNDKSFKGTFDGGNHTIANLKVDLTGKESVNAGLFGSAWQGDDVLKNVTIDGAVINTRAAIGSGKPAGVLVGSSTADISNVTVKNATIRSYRQSGGVVGAVYGNITDCKAENVDIALDFEKVGDKYDNADKAGAIAGFVCEGSFTLSGNSASNVKIEGYRDLGGLFGYIHGAYKTSATDKIYKDNSIVNATITQSFEHKADYDGVKDLTSLGEIAGYTYPDSGEYKAVVDGGGNTETDVTIIRGIDAVTNIQEFSAALDQGGIITVAAGTQLTVPGSVEIVKPVTVSLPADATIDFGSNQLRNKSEMTIKGNGTVSGSAFVIINDGGSMTIEGGIFKTTNTNLNYSPVRNESGDMVINGGYFEAPSGAAVATNFVMDRTGTLTINGGTFVNSKSGQYALNFYGDGELTVNDGTFIGNFGCARVGTSSYSDKKARATINGGTYICTNTHYAFAVDPDNTESGSSATIKGGKFWAKSTTLYCKSTSTLTLKGGKFKALNNYAPASGVTVADISETETVALPDGSSQEVNYAIELK